MTHPRTVRRSGLALALVVTATSLGSGLGTTDDPVAEWASQVWTAARAGGASDVERVLESLPLNAVEQDPLRAKTAGAVTRGLAQLREQRIEAAEARDDERDEALTRMREAIGEDNRSMALREAVIAQSHAADYDVFLTDPEIMDLVGWAEQQVVAEEAQRNWIDAQELLYLLRTFYEDTSDRDAFKRHQEELEVVNRRVELLSRYAPRALYDMRVARIERLGETPIGEFNPAQVIDYRERLQGIDRRMLYAFLSTAAEDHIESRGWRPLLEGGLEALATFATTVPLRTEFPKLGDAPAVGAWIGRVREWQNQIEIMKDSELSRRACIAMVEDLVDLNRGTLAVPEEVIVREFGDGAMGQLDLYSDIVWPDEVRRFQQQTEGDFVGVGILIRHTDKREIQIVQPLEGTPAYKAGILPGDTIVSVDGDPTVGWTLNDAVDRITGKRGDIVKLGVIREGDEDQTPIEIAVRRNVIKIHSVKGWDKSGIEADGEPIWNWLIDDTAGIAYVRLTQFTGATYADLRDAWDEIVKQYGRTPNGLILDLRHNPGGLLTAAVQISNLWIDRGIIVTGEDRSQQQVWRQQALGGRAPIADSGVSTVVLINKGSASASEIVAGALQAHGAALVVGERSFGKGSVQTVHQVAREGRIKLTTQYYRLPSPDGGATPGRLVHKRDGAAVWGVDPDVEAMMTVRQTADALTLRQRAEAAFLAGAEGIEPADINDLLTEGIDPQLQTAVLILQAQALSKLEAPEGMRHAMGERAGAGSE
jgi:carboxyl-terminal processing protease